MAKRKRHAYLVGASEYGGPGDPSSGHVGYKGDDLTGKMAFAELDMGYALGDLPHGTKLNIYRRESAETLPQQVVAEKLDIGRGGGPIKGKARRIDLWYQTAQRINFKGTGLVIIERVDGKPIPQLDALGLAVTPSKFALPEGPNTTTGAGVLGTGIGPQTEVEGHEASEEAKKGVEGVAGFLGELSFKKILLALVALGLGAFALIWLSRDLTGGAVPVPV